MSKHFQQIKIFNPQGRSGILNTRAGQVKTPFFMPVGTRSVVKGLESSDVALTGAQVLLSNTYHLHRSPGEKVIKKLGGLHKFNGWQGPILTDSGGFQVFSLAKIRKITEDGVYFKEAKSGDEVFISPEKSMQIQIDLGADIIMAFDDVTGLSKLERVRALEAMDRTHRWLDRCIVEFDRLTKNMPASKKPLLFGIVQGGLNKNYRKKSLEFIQSTSVDGVAIGGLAVGETRDEMYRMLDYLSTLYDPKFVRYLMGVGVPKDMHYAIQNGIDMFDCVVPTRNGRHGMVWLKGDKRINLNNIIYATDSIVIDPTCDCYACVSGYSRALLRHLFKINDPLAGRLTSIHHQRFLARLCENYQA